MEDDKADPHPSGGQSHTRGAQESREGRRAPVTGHLEFSGEEIQGDAVIRDLSVSGCQAWSETDLAVGLVLKLVLYLPDHPWPIKVERAVVRAVANQTFGVEFLTLLPSQQERLRTLVASVRQ